MDVRFGKAAPGDVVDTVRTRSDSGRRQRKAAFDSTKRTHAGRVYFYEALSQTGALMRSAVLSHDIVAF